MKPQNVFLSVGAAIGCLLVLRTFQDAPEGYWAPRAYVEQADTLIARGHLWLECATLDDVLQDSIRWDLEPGSREEIFFNSSYLRSDVRRFNADPRITPSPFRIEGCELEGANPFYHQIDLPLSRQTHWLGDVLYNTHGRVTTLFGTEGRSLEVRHPTSAMDRRRDALVPLSQEVDTGAHSLFFVAPYVEGYLADVSYIGIDPVLTDRRRTSRAPTVRVGGFELFPGRSVRLEEGDWIRFDLPGQPRTFLVDRETRRGTASLIRRQGRSVERLFLVERERAFVEPLAAAVNTALRAAWDQGRRSDALEGFGIRLSLNLDLSEKLDARIQGACREDPSPVPERPRSISMIVMDGFTGEVRAMPSCPNASLLDDRFPELSDQLRGRFLENQNLRPHPIGSAGKPFWAAAVSTSFPNFLDLEIEPLAAAEVDRVLGCALSQPYENSLRTTAPVGLERFIQNSCNRYQVEMATAALAIDPPTATAAGCTEPLEDPAGVRRCLPEPEPGQPSSRIRFCDRVIETVLSTEVRSVAAHECQQLQNLEREFLPRIPFERITNTQTVKEPRLRREMEQDPLINQYRTARYRTDGWRDVLDFMRREGVDVSSTRVRFPFSAASPEVTNLQLNTVRDLRGSWVNALLGGENSRWSNFQLAESLARLMTGRQVEGRFVSEVLSGGDVVQSPDIGELLPESALRDGVRRRVLHAMELVVEAGTARRLAQSVGELQQRVDALFPGDDGYDIYVVAKTGTPFVEKVTTRREVQVLQRLVAVGDLRWDPDERSFDVADPASSRLFGSLSPQYQRYIRQDVLSAVETSPSSFVQREGDPPPAHPFYFSPDGDLRVNPQRVRRRGAVLLLGIMAVSRRRGREASANREAWISACSLDPNLESEILEVPPRAVLDPSSSVVLSSALFIDDLRDEPGITSGRAVELMQQLLPDLGDFLVREISLREQGGTLLRNVGVR